MDDARFDVDTHDLFEFGNADVIVVQSLDMIDLSFVQAELGIEDVQVDADPCLIANVLNTIVFTSLVDNGLCFGDLLSCTADIEVSLLYSQLYRFARSLFCFSGDEEVLFCLVDFSLCRAAVIEGIGYAGSDIPAAAIGIESGEVIVRPAVAAANGNGRLLPASAMEMFRSAS